MLNVPVGAKIVRFIPHADLRCSHDGLAKLAKDELKVKVDDLKVGECVMFVNSAWTAFKIYCANNVILHYKDPRGHKLNVQAVYSGVPTFMKGREINYSKALTYEVLKARFPNRNTASLLAELKAEN